MTIKNYIEFIKESYGKSLHDLLDRGDVKQNEVSELISNGADIEEKDKAGWTPLMKAVHYEENIAVEELLENGADYNVETIYGTSPIGMVDNDIIFDLLINNGAKINGKIPERYFDARNRTILNNNVKIISKYLYNGSDINK